MSKFLFSSTLIVCSLFLGYALQRLSHAQIIRLPIALEDLRRILQKSALLGAIPITFVGAVWIIKMDRALTVFPLFGLGSYLLGGGAAIGASRLLKLPSARAGALFTCGYFSNVVSIGGFICYLFLGEQGFALMSLYRLLDPLSYYVIGFSIAKSYSLQSTAKTPLALRFKQLLTDPFILVNSASLALGGLLNFSGIERPGIFVTINALFIPISTMMILVSIGLNLKFGRITHYLRECVIVAVLKFILTPICMTLAALLVGFGGLDHGLPLKVVMILSAMPVAFNAVLATSIYDLDVDLTNSCFVFTTSLLVLVLPVLYYVTR